MKQFVAILFLSICNHVIFANDGAFFAKGNQLIPIAETEISVKKEILTIKKIRNEFIEITVYYEFFNPKNDKNILVGFEAFAPYGDVDPTPKNLQHPYIYDFTVALNNHILPYNVAYVNSANYMENGLIKSINLNQYNDENFYYVYHFNAKFKKGVTVIKHTYKYKLSKSVDYHYDFEYVLTAAKRWGNKQIDDFTLLIDMGEFETFNIIKNFFDSPSDWLLNGIAKTENIRGIKDTSIENDALRFHIQKGNIVFKKNNFKPNGELFLYSSIHNSSFENLPFSYYQQENIMQPKNDLERKILKNLPFARRGYVFKNSEIKAFYKKMNWYMPNVKYIATVGKLTKTEKEWIKKWE